MITSIVAAIVGIALAYGFVVPEQATAINGLGAALAALVLLFAKDPK